MHRDPARAISPARFYRACLAAVELAARARPAGAVDRRRLDAQRMLLGWFGEHDALPADAFERTLRERAGHTTSAALRAVYADVLARWRDPASRERTAGA